MGYLKCENCGGSYELKKGEFPEDFSDKCECGGNLNYYENSNSKENIKFTPQMNGNECPHCGFKNKVNAKFCKQCGKKMEKGLIKVFNDKINFMAVFIGLGVSCIVLIIGSLLFGSVVASASLDLSIYVGLVLISMVFFGGITTGIVGCEDFKDGAMNGLFMSLIAMVIMGFVVAVILFVVMGITAAIASAFKPYAATAASSTSSLGTSSTTSSSNSFDFVFNIIKGIIIIGLVFISGAVGGSCGVYLKNGFKNLNK